MRTTRGLTRSSSTQVLSCLNNLLLLRFDCNKFLECYRRIQPEAAEDIGVYQAIFEALNVGGAVSNAAIIIFSTPIFPGSDHHKDVLFIAVVACFFSLITLTQVVTDDIHPDVELQIRRNAFINSKIIDKVADEEDTLEFVHVDVKAAHVDKTDTLAPYYDTLSTLFRIGRTANTTEHH